MAGIVFGYNSVVPADKILTVRDIMWINFNWDFGDLESAMKNETNKVLKGNSHCSALIKLLRSKSDILVAHNTWTGYETMRRIMKRYYLPYKNVRGTAVSFSGYPGALVSGDDFYIVNSGLVVQETTNENNNASLWAYIRPTGQVLEVIRVTVANRLAGGGRSWTKIFSQYNSGTYNNQWMVVDMNKFSPGSRSWEPVCIVYVQNLDFHQINREISSKNEIDCHVASTTFILLAGSWADSHVVTAGLVVCEVEFLKLFWMLLLDLPFFLISFASSRSTPDFHTASSGRSRLFHQSWVPAPSTNRHGVSDP
ncbi:putative phospholipase B-like 2 [Homalodisca vitripennis]|nr:putative phospholipase B-like 2 [Homalodisca vitripennis]